MGVNMPRVYKAAADLRAAASDADSAVARLRRYQQMLCASWSGAEMSYVNECIEQTVVGLRSASFELKALSSDIVASGEAVKRQEAEAAHGMGSGR